ncbi:MAG: M61 family metallopeptidase [Gammaproteobacteria bacterium]
MKTLRVFMGGLVLAAWIAAPAFAADITTAYPGTIALQVDLTHAPEQRIFYVHEIIPVKPGPLTLYYPEWIPGEHSPSGPLANLVGTVFTANGQVLNWRRDLVDMYAIHLTVPAGASRLDVTFQFLSPLNGGEFGAGVSVTPVIADLEWNQVVLYPAGYVSRAITVAPSLKLPAGWQYASALEPHTGTGGEIHFEPVTLNNLVDSPVISGLYFKQLDLDPGAKAGVFLDMVADSPADLAVKPEQLQDFRNLVQQQYRMYGAHHYSSYHALLKLSAHTDHFGLEHHQSSDDRISPDYFINPQNFLRGSTLVPHEYTHSWNGKFRRPAGLWTPDFNTEPMQGNLLWVYEGYTQYMSGLMATRSGFWTPAQYRASLATTAASLDHEPGRTWRPLQDTADEAQILYYAPFTWHNWRRGTDFYSEGVLLWLDVDTKIRELSHDRRSINDFTRLFYGMDNGSYVTKTYTFDDIVTALNTVQPYDWAAFLRQILNTKQAGAPLAGITRGGWKLMYTDKPSKAFGGGPSGFGVNAMYTLGLSASASGNIFDVLWNGPSFEAGLAPGMQIVAVNGTAFTPKLLDAAITAATGTSAPIQLLIKNVERYQTYAVNYHDGLRYPHLERIPGSEDYLDQIVAPLKK